MTTSFHASTSLVLPSIITKLMLKAQSTETLSDGTKTITFKGFVSSMDAHLIYLACATNDGLERHTKNHVVFSAKGEKYDWSAKQNYVPRGGRFYITFVMNDYTQTKSPDVQETIFNINDYSDIEGPIYEQEAPESHYLKTVAIGGFILTFWVDDYGNEGVTRSHCKTIAKELDDQIYMEDMKSTYYSLFPQ